VSAGESALHKFAKKILDERREIYLPLMAVANGKDRLVVVQPRRLKFDRAVLETREGEIVPDVVLELQDRRLIVEFMVTHACSERKIEYIKKLDIGAIEIDLSQYRDRLLTDISDEILHSAPRVWVHHPRELDALAQLEEKARRRAEERSRLLETLRGAYRHRLPSDVPGEGEFEIAARLEGLGDVINLPVSGSGCIDVPVAEWQAAALLAIIGRKNPSFGTHIALAAVESLGWLNKTFRDLDKATAAELRRFDPNFALPVNAIERYLKHLESMYYIIPDIFGNWRITEKLRRKISNAKETRERPTRRLNDLRQLVARMLFELPSEETDSFNFDDWATTKPSISDHSAMEAINLDEHGWRAFRGRVSSLLDQVRLTPHKVEDIRGLPLEAELQRSWERRRQDELARERAEQVRLNEEALSRVTRLRNRAIGLLGLEATHWLNNVSGELDGRSPEEAAAEDDGPFSVAMRALEQRADAIWRQAEARRIKKEAVAKLYAAALTKYVTQDAADLWMRATHRGLGGQSPADFAIDETTCKICIDLLPEKRSRR